MFGNNVLTKCKTCDKEVSQSAKICPHCGQKNPGVKNWQVLIFLAIIMLVTWILIKACGADSDQTSKVVQQKQTVEESMEFKINKPNHNINVTLDDFSYSYNNLLNNYKKELGKDVISLLKVDPKFMYIGGFGDVYKLIDVKSTVADIDMSAVIDKDNKKLEGLTFKFLDKSDKKDGDSTFTAIVFLTNIIDSLGIHGEDADALVHRLMTEHKTTNGRLISDLTYNDMHFFFVIVEVNEGVLLDLRVD